MKTIHVKQSTIASKSKQVTELAPEPTLDGSFYRCSPHRSSSETSTHVTKRGTCGKPLEITANAKDRLLSSGIQRFREVSPSSLAPHRHFAQANLPSQWDNING